MQISTLEEAAAELTALTGSPWSVSKVLDYCSQKLIPLSATITIEEKHVKALRRRQPTEPLWQGATGFSTYAPLKPEAVWLLLHEGIANIRHPVDRPRSFFMGKIPQSFDGPSSFSVREIPVTREQVRVKEDALQKIYASWLDENPQQVEALAMTASPAVAGNEPVPASKRTGKRRTWEDVAMPYVVETYRAGKYKTAHTFYVTLVNKAWAGNSPFTLHDRKLFLTDLGQSVAEKTIANAMPKIKAAARLAQI